MATHVASRHSVLSRHDRPWAGPGTDALRYAVPLGRVLFSLIFLVSVPGLFTAQGIEHAASQGVPFASIAVPLAGVLALLGGLSVVFGYHARIGALLLILFLVPVTVLMHRFWGIEDAQAAMLQRIHFMKNVALLGGAVLLSYFGAGPVSIDARQGR
jgi:putative oxidoreductase